MSKLSLPISFAEFAKEPIKGVLFITLLAIGYLYVDGRMNNTKQIEAQNIKIEQLEKKVDNLSAQLRKSDSLMLAATAKLKVLQELGQIK
jgi:hypothetical protein